MTAATSTAPLAQTARNLVALSLLLSACSGGGKDAGPTTPTLVLTTVVVSLSAATISVGQTVTASATGLDQNGGSISLGAVTWSSGSLSVATVNASGVVSGVAPGQAQIIATAGGKQGQQTITVIPIPVTSVTVAPTTATLAVGATQQLTASTLDASGNVLTSRVVTWSTSDATKASVSATGLVTGVAAGTATITATSETKTGTSTLTIGPVPVATVTVTPASASLVVGATQQLTATTKDASGNSLTGRVVVWSTSDASKALVSQSGLVTAAAVGAATISATSEGKTGTASVTVSAAVPIVTVGNWTSIGPHHIPEGGHLASGKLQALAIFSGDPNIMYAGGGLGSGREGPVTEAGAFKTTDGGAHWTAINTGLVDPMVNALWVDPVNSNVVLAGTEFGGIFKSVDGGMSWALTGNLGATSEFVSAGGKVLAATAAGVAQSADLGATWAVMQPAASPVRALAAGGGAIVAGLQNWTIMMQSTPTGVWQSATTAGEIVSVAVDASNPTTAYAVSGCCPGTLIGTSNGGVTWSPITVPSGPQAILMTSDTRILYAAGNGFMFSSTNAGQSWTATNAIWDNRRIFAVPGQSAIIVGTDQGLYRTSNGGNTWADLSGSVYSSILTAVAVRGSTIFTAVQDFSPIVSFDGGGSWQQPAATSANAPLGEDGTALINPARSSYCYAYTTAGYQYSTDGCRTFYFTSASGLSGGVTYTQPGLPDIVAVDPSAPSTVYAASVSGVFKSTDWGVTMMSTGWPMTQTTAIAVDPSDSRIIYVGTNSTLYRTQDGGATWSQLSLAGAAGSPATIAVNPLNPQVVLVGLSNGPGRGGGVLRSTDRGNTFKLVNTGLSSVVRASVCCGVDVYSVRFNASAIAALATSTGVYVSADLGDHWQDVRANAVSSFFTDVAWDGGYLYAATFGQGVLRAPVTVVPTAAVRSRRP